jgi:uncharacterized protein
MASSYKTPGVYVEEISKLPPSVAEVDTAIPAFVGYTEKAKRYVDNDLLKVPTRVKSLLDYEMYFGKGPSYTGIHLQLTAQNIPDVEKTSILGSIYNLYESMRLFFDNGGGVCYVCSAGLYSAGDSVALRATAITNALAEVKKFDEPTLLLFPDAVNLITAGAVDWDKLSGIQQAALKQCGDLGDRFAILDVPDETSTTAIEEADKFRSKIGMNNLKYGAAYTPYLKTIYDKEFRLRDIMPNLYLSDGVTKKDFKTLFSDADKDSGGNFIKPRLDEFTKLYTDTTAINARLSVFSGKTAAETFDSSNLDATYQAKLGAYNSAADDAGRIAALKALFEFVFANYAQLEGLVNPHALATEDTGNTPGLINATPIRTSVITNAALKTSISGLLASNLKASLQILRNLDNEAYRTTPKISNVAGEMPAAGAVTYMSLLTDVSWAPAADPVGTLIPAGSITVKGNAAVVHLTALFQAVKSGLNSAISISKATEEATEKALIPELPMYNSFVRVLNSKVNTLPPSGAIAGVYATVDRERGVWKAPANVTINSVSDVSQGIDDSDQESLNIDTNAGKSVNAIRAFYGKGIMVWGSRTLAGNDSEWRYVPVRRLFSFVEESCKKSTSWSVFEPNDANTWARIRSQVDNFLNNMWKRGALAGAKPEHAYYVNCGLGITMSSQDILEGRLIVEIGMAAVRPAEFVILKFSHKLQQS